MGSDLNDFEDKFAEGELSFEKLPKGEDKIDEKELIAAAKDARTQRFLPWQHHNQVKDSAVPMEYISDLVGEILRKSNDEKGYMRAAAISLIYLTGSRVREILPNNPLGYNGITRGDLRISTFQSPEGPIIILSIQSLIEKTRGNREHKEKGKNYIFKYKQMHINAEAPEYQTLLEVIDKHISKLEEKKGRELSKKDPLFKGLKYQTLYIWMNRKFPDDGFNFHSLRHWRATHLANPPYNLNEEQLRKVFGWSPKSNMPVTYVSDNEVILTGKLIKTMGFY